MRLKKMWLLLMALAWLVTATGRGRAGEGFISLVPSLNFIRIRSEPVNSASAPGGGILSLPGGTKWKTTPGLGVAAGLPAGDHWKLGLSYDYLGRVKVSRDGGSWNGAEKLERLGKFDFHNLHLLARFSLAPGFGKSDFFAYGKAGITLVHAKFEGVRSGNPSETLHLGSRTRPLFSYGLGMGTSYSFTPRLSGELMGEFFQAAGREMTGVSGKTGLLGFKIGAGLTLKF